MSLTQRIFYCSMAAWLALSIGMAMWFAPWMRWSYAHMMAVVGAAILLAGMVAMVRECWRCWPADAARWARWAIAVANTTTCLAAATFASVYLVYVHYGDQMFTAAGLRDFIQWDVLDWLVWCVHCIVWEFEGTGWRPVAVSGAATFVMLALAWGVRRLLFRGRPTYSARRHVVRWVVLCATGVIVVVVMGSWGYVLPRRAGLVALIILRPELFVSPDQSLTLTEVTSSPATLGFSGTPIRIYHQKLDPGTCCEVNGQRCFIGARVADNILWRPADGAIPPTSWLIIGDDGSPQILLSPLCLNVTRTRTIGNVVSSVAGAGPPARHVWGPWYEWDDALGGDFDFNISATSPIMPPVFTY